MAYGKTMIRIRVTRMAAGAGYALKPVKTSHKYIDNCALKSMKQKYHPDTQA
jgi:cobyrinic acid a,c-diamide synthase